MKGKSKMKKNKLNNEKRKLALKGFEKFFEQENNIYRKEYYLQKERVDKDTINAFEIATRTVEKTYPPKDVAQLMVFQKKQLKMTIILTLIQKPLKVLLKVGMKLDLAKEIVL
jgi:hypothetical protein